MLNNNLMLKLPDDVHLIVEGSGADVKYYAQLGADAASKKRLGNHMLKTGNITVAYGTPKTVSVQGKIFAVILSGSNSVLITSCPYWDGTNLCNNSNGSVHVGATIANNRESVQFYCTQTSAKTIDYAIFYNE